MGGFDFERPVGANADVMELEYIAALHQTDHADDAEFANASIESSDVKYYLLSRYGIVATQETIRELIFKGLAGGDGENDCIDIAEMVAILLIPFFSKITGQSNEAENTDSFVEHEETTEDKGPFSKDNEMHLKHLQFLDQFKDIISDMFSTILLETTGSPEPRLMTKELLHAIFAQYNELDLIKNNEILVDEMIQQVTGGGDNIMLNSETFTRALTGDIKLYDTKEDRQSTHYEDAFGIDGEDVDKADIDSAGIEQEKDYQRVFNFPQIDALADTFRSKSHFVLSLIAFILSVMVYYLEAGSTDFIAVCHAERRENYACRIGLQVVVWMFRMVTIIALGIPFIIALNLGNDLHHGSIIERIGGLLAAIILVILPSFLGVDLYLVDTTIMQSIYLLKIIGDILRMTGFLLVIIQVSSIIQKYVPHNVKWLNFLRGSAVRNEVDLKLAAATKVRKMVWNAYALHKDEDDTRVVGDDNDKSSNAVALLNFTKESATTETSGGFFWCWKQFFSGCLLSEEGIWIHTRILIANFVQLSTLLLIVTALSVSTGGLIGLFNKVDNISDEAAYATIPNNLNESCVSRFDYNKCSFPQMGSNRSIGIAICPVSYNDGCQFAEVTDVGIKEQFCSILDGFVKIWSSDGLTSCPSLVTVTSKPLYSFTHDSVESAYCGGALSTCVSMSSGTNVTSLCFVGLNENFMPYRFGGTSCSSIPQIAELLEDNPVQRVDDVVDKYVPEQWMITISMSFGIIAASFAGVYNVLCNIPSIVVTTLRFRSGVFPSLRDDEFKKYRVNMFNPTTLIGASVYGTFFMICFILVFVSAPIFILVYPITNVYVWEFSPLIIGITATVVFKILARTLLTKYNFAGFYRKRPVLCNIAIIGFECWNFILSALVIIIRAVKVLIITFLFLGRFDTPFLADGVGKIGTVEFDTFPTVFRQDLLATDAHRHPYIERLGLMYMKKLRHGNKFATQAGSNWRLLFVMALMPWLQKYRITSDVNVLEDNTETQVGNGHTTQ